MYMAAAPYFAKRFHTDEWILAHFQSSIISVGTVTNLISMIVLANLQSKASYQKRIASALIINISVFTLLALSTIFFREVSAGGYLAFVLSMVFCTSIATGLIQNGAFAFASGFGHPSYIQAIMTGQGIAGVLPPIAQIASVLSIPAKTASKRNDGAPQESSTSAFVYFLTACVVSVVALLAFIPLCRRHKQLVGNRMMESTISVQEAEQANRKVVSLWTLYEKLHWLAASVYLCFAVTMFFPVYTAQILSVNEGSRLFEAPTFIPLAFLVWNTGDLIGRLSTILPFSLRHKPFLLFVVAIGRLGFLPLYLLCNVGGRGATVSSDIFYLFVVQLGFGLTNGWLGGSCMMGANEWVEDSEREATGGFMGLNLVAGLTTGSLLSFAAH
jgi:equilibrative nucleoside transporter 1/2/3